VTIDNLSDDARAAFHELAIGRGLDIAPEDIVADGVIRRCTADGRPDGEPGAFMMYSDGRGGWVCNHRDGLGTEKWLHGWPEALCG